MAMAPRSVQRLAPRQLRRRSASGRCSTGTIRWCRAALRQAGQVAVHGHAARARSTRTRRRGAGVTVSPRDPQNLGIRTALVRKAPLGAERRRRRHRRAATSAIDVVVQSRATATSRGCTCARRSTRSPQGNRWSRSTCPTGSARRRSTWPLRKANIELATLVDGGARAACACVGMTDEQIVAASERDGAAQSRFTLTRRSRASWPSSALREGMTVQPGMTLFRIAGPVDRLGRRGRAGERRRRCCAPARSAQATSAALSGANVHRQGAARSFRKSTRRRGRCARASSSPIPAWRLSPACSSTCNLAGAPREALVVPQEAVIATGKRNVVIVAGGTATASSRRRRRWAPGGRGHPRSKRAREGQRVVTSGQFLHRLGSEPAVALPRLRSPAGAATAASTAANAAGSHRAGRQGRVDAGARPHPVDQVAVDDDAVQACRVEAAAGTQGTVMRSAFEFIDEATATTRSRGSSARRASHDRRLIRWSLAQPLPRAADDRVPRRVGASGRCSARRSTRFPICRTCRSSFARSIPARRRRSSRTRSPIR